MWSYIAKIAFFSCLLLLFSGGVHAKKWDFQPKLSLIESYYDNITLAEQNKNKELVTQVETGFSLSKSSRRIQLASDYAFGYTKYLGNDFSDGAYNRASASVNVEAIRRHFFVNANASISQQVVDPSQASSNDVAFVSDNQTETRTISVQPRLINRFGRYANSDLSFEYILANYSNATLSDSRQSTIEYNLISGRWFKRANWSANVTRTNSNQVDEGSSSAQLRIEYDLSQHWTVFLLGRAQKHDFLANTFSQTQSDMSRYYINPEAGVIWVASRKLKVEVGGGGRLNAKDLGDRKFTIENPTWRAIVNLAPSKRTGLSFGRDSSIFGDRKFFDLSIRTRRTNWTSGYSETLITPQQLRIDSSFDASAFSGASSSGELPFSQELGRAVTNDVILRKRLDFDAAIKSRILTLSGGVFHDSGEYQTVNLNDKRYGVNGGLDLALGRSMSWSNQVSAQRYYFDGSIRVDHIYTANSSLSRRIKKNMNVNLEYRWQKRASQEANAKYTAQQLTARLDVTF